MWNDGRFIGPVFFFLDTTQLCNVIPDDALFTNIKWLEEEVDCAGVLVGRERQLSYMAIEARFEISQPTLTKTWGCSRD